MSRFTALHIADFYVQLSNDLPEADMTNLKLNKLCYYAQGWSLVKLGQPLFDEDIQAWDHGPVVPSVYRTYKVCGDNLISEPSEPFDESTLSVDELNLLIDVYNSYAKFSASALVTMTHRPGSPWRQVYEKRMNRVISPDLMLDYFRRHTDELETPSFCFTDDNVVSYA